MTVLCLTGWQQPANALANIVPDAVHFDYGAYDNVKNMFEALPKAPRLAIGWSLGGQLLVRAIAGGHIKPASLMLLGVPFQWVADAQFTEGVPAEAVSDIKANYARDPQAMLKNFNALIALNDKHEKQILRVLNKSVRVWPNGMYWRDELARTSCVAFNFSDFPPTTIIHGTEDKVIRPINAKAFAERLPQAELLLWPHCAHAPHLHDAPALTQIVNRYV